jgi:hypothetical protein
MTENKYKIDTGDVRCWSSRATLEDGEKEAEA